MRPSERFDRWQEPAPAHLELTEWGWMVAHPDNLSFGGPSDIGAFTFINARAGVYVGADVQIGSHCAIHSSSSIDDKRGSISLRSGACIGSHSTVMPGVTVGRKATVAAHTFVNRDVPPAATVGGVPMAVLDG